MILSDRAIKNAMLRGDIVIRPWEEEFLGSNSYDVHLAPTIGFYPSGDLDVKQQHELILTEIGEHGFMLMPGELYLGATAEYTATRCHVPFLEGKSSLGRLGLSIHATAGKGDVGFCGHWTLEMSVIRPLRIYAGMPIGQLIYFDCTPVGTLYEDKIDAKYKRVHDRQDLAVPIPSRMYRNFQGR